MEWIPKIWGGEQIIVNNDQYCGKILTFIKDHKASFHFHKLKTETFHILDGRILLIYSSEDVNKLEKHKDVVKDILDNAYNNRYSLSSFRTLVGYSPPIHCIFLSKGESFQIDPLLVHQAIALEDSKIIEFSTHSDDSDSYRIVIGS